MDSADDTRAAPRPQPTARRSSASSRPSSTINGAMGGAPEPPASAAAVGYDDYDGDGDESVRGFSTKSRAVSREPRGSQDPVSDPGSVRSSDDAEPTKAEDGSIDPEPPASGMSGISAPVQKRRRVTRACDECRRKKIKCDGRSPCTHCSVYSYECTYDKPSNRRRNPAPQYIEALENRLQRAEALLRKFVPDVDLTDPKLDPSVQQEFANRERARAQAAARLGNDEAPAASATPSSSKQQQQKLGQKPQSVAKDGEQDVHLMSMVETIGHLDLIDGNEWDFHGVSSGAAFLRRLKEQMGVLVQDAKSPFLPRPPRPPGMFNLDSPRSSAGSPWESIDVPAMYELPPREVARSLCQYSLNCATCLLRIVHIPSFYEMFDRLYEKGPENLGPDDHRQLGLLYSVMALGSIYLSADDDAATQMHYKVAIEQGCVVQNPNTQLQYIFATQDITTPGEGGAHSHTIRQKYSLSRDEANLGDRRMKYYSVARQLLQDITECRDLTSLQALLFLILFLQSTSNLSGCYAFLGIALRTALRMGLHRHLSHDEITPIEDESRRRVFYVIRQLDTYVSALLGYPLLLHDDDIDQPLPTEIDDEYITKDAIGAPPPGTPSFIQAMNAHSKLMQILARVIKTIHPARGIDEIVVKGEQQPRATYMINYTSIKEIEHDLQEWLERLPNAWRLGTEGSPEVVRVRFLLRFTYAHVQMLLYRPFLHYVSPRLSNGKDVDERYYACAAACVSVSRNIIHIGMEIRKHAALLVGPYWFILYTEFFAILSLTFYALENPDKPGTAEILADANAGREFIASLSTRSLAADRVTDGLNIVFEQLPDRIKKAKGQARPRPVASKKRAAPGPRTSHAPIKAQPSSRGSEEPTRPQSGDSVPDRQPRQMSQRTAMEAATQRHLAGHPGHPFMSSFGEPIPMDLVAGSASPDSDVGPFRRPAPQAGFHQVPPTHMHGSPSMYNKMGAMIFPSGDPFEYPSQPLVDFGGGAVSHPPPQQRGGAAAHHHPSPGQRFYGMPQHHVFDDIDGQLLGHITPYMVQQGGAAMSELDDLAAQIYDASSMTALQQQQQRHAGAGSMAPHSHHSQHNPGSGPPPVPGGRGGGGAGGGSQAEMDDILLTESGFGAFQGQQQLYRQL